MKSCRWASLDIGSNLDCLSTPLLESNLNTRRSMTHEASRSGQLDLREIDVIHRDPWLRTGDVAYADELGNFYIVDRVKELIKYKAYPVAPAELESVLLSHPLVRDAAVVPVPDDTAGQIPKAFVVGEKSMDAAELMSWVSERVAPYKKIRKIEFVEEIPKSASGKILRRVLMERNNGDT